MKQRILKLLIFILILTQSSFAQKYNANLISKDTELNFAFTKMRGIERNNVIYYVEKDLQTVSAYKNNKLLWQTNVVSVCEKSVVGKPDIRYLRYEINRLFIICGKHSFAEVDTANGKTKLLGSD
jgi:hypothetical protein